MTEIVLNRLLDKYENSTHYNEPNRSNRRIMLNVKELPEYEYQNADMRDAFNKSIEELERLGVIGIEWVSGRNKQLFSKLWLILDHVELAYELIKRIPLWKQAESFAKLFADNAETVRSSWLKEALTKQVAELTKTRRLTVLCRNGISHTGELIKALVKYDSLDGTITMRAFSIDCYRDSKHFERYIIKDFLSFMRTHNPDLCDAMEESGLKEREQLALLGIMVRPELYELAGNISVETHRGTCGLDAFADTGIAIASASVPHIRCFHMENVRRVMFIENKTCYDEYLLMRQVDELVVYHGGFLSAQKRKLFEQLYKCAEAEVDFRFWGDIDLGGFRMFVRLKEVIPCLTAWHMGKEDVEAYYKQGLERQSDYFERLHDVTLAPEYEYFKDAVNALLEHRVTIEQEVMLAELSDCADM